MRETSESSNPIRPRISESSDGEMMGIEEAQQENDKKEKSTEREQNEEAEEGETAEPEVIGRKDDEGEGEEKS